MSNDPASSKSSQPIEPPSPEDAGSPSKPLHYGARGGVFWAAIAGALMWIFLHGGYAVFRLPEEFQHRPTLPSGEWARKALAAEVVTRGQNTMFAMGLFGALVAGLLAVGSGVVRRSVPAALVGGAIAAVLAAAAGCTAGCVGHLVWKGWANATGDVPLSAALLMHTATFGILGGGVGAALGCAAVRKLSAFFAYLTVGVLAGAAAGMLYPFLSAVLAAFFGFQGQTDVVVPAGGLNGALWVAVPSLLLGLGIPGMKWTRASHA